MSSCSSESETVQASEQAASEGQQQQSEQVATLRDLKAHFIDVGQGDSELLELPDGKWMLIDAGDSKHGDGVVQYLQNAGVQQIDYLVATHPHADHIGGMTKVLSNFSVGELWMPDASEDTETFNNFLDAVDLKGITVQEAKAGETIIPSSSGYVVSILGPPDGLQSNDMNDYSIVIKVEYGDTSMLFTGDASAQEIVDDAPGHVDVLKAAHHGSETGTNTAVMEVTTPSNVVMSYEEGNSYGHPDQSVLDAIRAAGATAYSTAANGDITATSDGSSVSIETTKNGTITAGVSAEEKARQEAEAKAAAEAQVQAEAKAQAETAAQAEAARQQEAANVAVQQQGQEQTVYVNKTGEKYHRSGCPYLRKSCISMSLSDAKAAGYEPCSKCF